MVHCKQHGRWAESINPRQHAWLRCAAPHLTSGSWTAPPTPCRSSCAGRRCLGGRRGRPGRVRLRSRELCRCADQADGLPGAQAGMCSCSWCTLTGPQGEAGAVHAAARPSTHPAGWTAAPGGWRGSCRWMHRWAPRAAPPPQSSAPAGCGGGAACLAHLAIVLREVGTWPSAPVGTCSSQYWHAGVLVGQLELRHGRGTHGTAATAPHPLAGALPPSTPTHLCQHLRGWLVGQALLHDGVVEVERARLQPLHEPRVGLDALQG